MRYGDGYEVLFVVKGSWNGGHHGKATIKDTENERIEDWIGALHLEDGTFYMIDNSCIRNGKRDAVKLRYWALTRCFQRKIWETLLLI